MLAGIEDMEQRDRRRSSTPARTRSSSRVGQADLLQRHPGRDKPALVLRIDVANIYGEQPPRRARGRLVIDDPVGHAVRLDAACVVRQPARRPRRRTACAATASRTSAAARRVRPRRHAADGRAARRSSRRAPAATASTATSTASSASSARRSSSAPTSSRPTRPTTCPTTTASSPRRARARCCVRGGGRVTDKEILERTHTVLEQGARRDRLRAQRDPAPRPRGDDRGADVGRARRRVPGRRSRDAAVSVARVGIVGGGLMGRELAAAIGRWAALEDHPVTPRLDGVCDTSPEALRWFDRIASVTHKTTDRRHLLEDARPRRPLPRRPAPPARAALPRHDRRRQGLPGREAVRHRPRRRPSGSSRRSRHAGVFVRCSSEMPYFPGAQLAYDTIRSGRARPAHRGRARLPALQRPRPRQADQLEAPGAILRRDRRDERPRDARRCTCRCGSAGGRAAVYAALQDIVTERPGPDGEPVPCDTCDNATLHVDAGFPLTLAHQADRPGADEHVAHPRARHGRRRRASRPPARRWCTASPSATAARSGSASRSAASRPSRPSPGRSSSSASPTRSCRCGRPTSPSARARSATASDASLRKRR